MIPKNIIKLTPDDAREVWNIFNGQTKKGTSFVDCANLYAAEKFKLKICSFDTFYPKKYILSVLK